jgi:hypothetical protein
MSHASVEVVPDATYPGMWRIRTPDGALSDMVNRARARDAAKSILLSPVKARTDGHSRSPVRFARKADPEHHPRALAHPAAPNPAPERRSRRAEPIPRTTQPMNTTRRPKPKHRRNPAYVPRKPGPADPRAGILRTLGLFPKRRQPLHHRSGNAPGSVNGLPI